MRQSRHDLLGIEEEVNLEEIIQIPGWVEEGLYRCRVSYSNEIEKIEFFPYQVRHPKLILLVEDTSVIYPYKYEDRSCFQNLMGANPEADDIFVLHHGNLTDATFANIAFFDGAEWLTPETPLLKGTKRQNLIDKGILIEAPIRAENLGSFRQLALVNAMRDLDRVYDFSFHNNYLTIHGTY